MIPRPAETWSASLSSSKRATLRSLRSPAGASTQRGGLPALPAQTLAPRIWLPSGWISGLHLSDRGPSAAVRHDKSCHSLCRCWKVRPRRERGFARYSPGKRAETPGGSYRANASRRGRIPRRAGPRRCGSPADVRKPPGPRGAGPGGPGCRPARTCTEETRPRLQAGR